VINLKKRFKYKMPLFSNFKGFLLDVKHLITKINL